MPLYTGQKELCWFLMQADPTCASRKRNIAYRNGYLSISEEFSWPVITQMLIFLSFTRRWLVFALIALSAMAPYFHLDAHSRPLRALRSCSVPTCRTSMRAKVCGGETNRLNRKRRSSGDAWKAELVKIEKQIRGIIEAINAGMFHESMKAEMDTLEAHKAELTALLADRRRTSRTFCQAPRRSMRRRFPP